MWRCGRGWGSGASSGDWLGWGATIIGGICFAPAVAFGPTRGGTVGAGTAGGANELGDPKPTLARLPSPQLNFNVSCSYYSPAPLK